MSEKDFSELTLEKWSNRFFDANPGLWDKVEPAWAWLRFVEISAFVAERVRTEEYAKMITGLGKALGWLLCFVKAFGKEHPKKRFRLFSDNLSEMFWRKYPGTCYRCAHELAHEKILGTDYLPCVCLAVPVVPEDRKAFRESYLEKAREKPRPSTLDEWANMIKVIYGPNHRQLSLSAVALHFLEEVGEVAEDLRKLRELGPKPDEQIKRKRVMKLQEEIADVFSWILGLLNKLDQSFEKSREYYDPSGEVGLPPLKASTIARDTLNKWRGEVVP